MSQNRRITEQEYLLLCNYCDRILKDRAGDLMSIAIPSLHILREHPILLKRYLFFIRNTFVDRFKQFSKIVFGWIRIFSLSFFRKNIFWYSSRENQNTIHYLFVSHLLNEDYDKQEGDFYFDRLPYMLEKEGFSSAIALINHTKQDKPFFFRNLSKRQVPFFLFTKHLSIRNEVCFLFRIIAEAFKLQKLKKLNIDPGFVNVINSAVFDAFSDNAVNSLRVHKQIAELVRVFKPVVIITTYEGHGWERLAYAAARLSNPFIKCIAYQHSAIFRLQHAIKRPLGPKYDPDIILCSGLVGKNQLDMVDSISHIQKFVLGSHRTINIYDDFDKSNIDELRKKEISKYCLVLPEGDIDECNILFEFSLKCAKSLADIKFVWRLHPLVTFENLIAQNSNFKNLPNNIILSSDILSNDINKCSAALYRGTTAIIPAVYKGLKPIYLALIGEMTIDPLYEINKCSNYAYNVYDFKKKFEQNFPSNEYLIMKDYCTKIFQPLNYNLLKQILYINTSN